MILIAKISILISCYLNDAEKRQAINSPSKPLVGDKYSRTK